MVDRRISFPGKEFKQIYGETFYTFTKNNPNEKNYFSDLKNIFPMYCFGSLNVIIENIIQDEEEILIKAKSLFPFYNTCNYDAEYNHIKILDHFNDPFKCDEETFRIAVENGSIECIKYLAEKGKCNDGTLHGIPFDNIVNAVIMRNNYWFTEEEFNKLETCTYIRVPLNVLGIMYKRFS